MAALFAAQALAAPGIAAASVLAFAVAPTLFLLLMAALLLKHGGLAAGYGSGNYFEDRAAQDLFASLTRIERRISALEWRVMLGALE